MGAVAKFGTKVTLISFEIALRSGGGSSHQVSVNVDEMASLLPAADAKKEEIRLCTVHIEGMTCGSCVKNIETAVRVKRI